MEWFRSWHGAPTDPKWLMIAQRTQTNAGMVSAVVWALFDHASQASERGDVSSFDAETYAAYSGWEAEKVAAIITALTDKGFLKNNKIAAWGKRQPKREDGSAERAKQWRERKRTQANENDHRTEQNREDNNNGCENFRKVGEVKASGPRHGTVSSRRGTVFIRQGTDDWRAYVDDYRKAFGVEPEPNKDGGFWFKIAGTAALPEPKRLSRDH